MKLLKYLCLFLFLPVHGLGQQVQEDTLIVLPGVDVEAERLFQPETAGIKESRIDSTIMLHKMNLTLSELLSENTPIFIKSNGRGSMATATFRGTAPSHTQVNWNGININSPMLGMVDFSLIPVFITDQVTLNHGNSSVSKGSGGLGGTISITNKPGWNDTLSFSYMQGIGSFSTFEEYLQVGAGNKKIQARIRLYHNQSDNDFTFINKSIANLTDGELVNPVDTNNHAAYKLMGILQEIYYQPIHGHVISLKWWGQQSERSIPMGTSYEGSARDSYNRIELSDNRVVADWSIYREKSKIMLRSGYTNNYTDFILRNQIYGLGLVARIKSESRQRSFLNQAFYSMQLNNNISVEASLDINYHDVFTTDTVTKMGYEKNRNEYFGLVTFKINPWKFTHLTLMLRQEVIDNEIIPIIPFAGIDILLSDKNNILFKANAARNYRYPSLNDLYWLPGGNPELLPEQGTSYEAGFHHQKSYNELQLETALTFFHSDIDNWIIWLPGINLEPQNIKRVKTEGIEFNAQVKKKIHSFNLTMLGSYAYTSTINLGDPISWGDESIGKQLVYIPKHSGNLFTQLSYRNYRANWQHNYYGERYTTTSNNKSRRDWLYPYFMNDVTVAGDFTFNRWIFSAELKVYNLFNETYRTVLYHPMPGRNYMIIIKLTL